jgi:hypothetical protein
LDEGTVDHAVYIEKVLPVALKYGNQVFGSDWVFQQDGVETIFHHLLTSIIGLQIVLI